MVKLRLRQRNILRGMFMALALSSVCLSMTASGWGGPGPVCAGDRDAASVAHDCEANHQVQPAKALEPMKMIMFFRRKPGMSVDEFIDYYENRHVPMALELFPYFKSYRRNYMRPGRGHQRTDGSALEQAFQHDVITELSFHDVSDYERMLSEMQDPVVRRRVVEDEMNFMDRDATVVVLVNEHVSDLSRTK